MARRGRLAGASWGYRASGYVREHRPGVAALYLGSTPLVNRSQTLLAPSAIQPSQKAKFYMTREQYDLTNEQL